MRNTCIGDDIMATKIIKCKFCTKAMKDEELYAEHIVRRHSEQIIPEMVPRQFVYTKSMVFICLIVPFGIFFTHYT